MTLADREVELVSTWTGRSVHAFWPHAHRTACGITDDRVFPFVSITDGDFQACARCAKFLLPTTQDGGS